MTIRTRPSTPEYRENFERIFKLEEYREPFFEEVPPFEVLPARISPSDETYIEAMRKIGVPINPTELENCK